MDAEKQAVDGVVEESEAQMVDSGLDGGEIIDPVLEQESVQVIEDVGKEEEVEVETAPVVQLSTTESLVADLRSVNQALYPPAEELPSRPPPANECNFVHYFAIDVDKELQDQYVYRHANGLCVIGLAPTHPALLPFSQIAAVDFNVGKQSRAEMKVSGKHKKNGHALEPMSALCKVITGDSFYVPRCCVRGVLLEVNERLMKDPGLLKTRAGTDGHIAVLMPRPEDWAKAEKTFYTRAQYKELRGLTNW